MRTTSRRKRLLPETAPNEGAKRLRTLALRTTWARLEEISGVDRDSLMRYSGGRRHPDVTARVSLESKLGIPPESWFQEVRK
jgi:hypothetical protein